MMDFSALEQQNGLPPGLLNAVMNQESGGDPNAVSPKGAVGAFQMMPATAQQYGIDPTNPDQSAQAAATMLGQLNQKYQGSLPHVLAGYNWGQGNVDRQGLQNAPPETQNYIQSVMGKLGNAIVPQAQAAEMPQTQPNVFDVTMPDGTVIKGVPQGTTQSQLQAKLAKMPQSDAQMPLNQQMAANQNAPQGQDLGADPAFYGGIMSGAVPFGQKITAGLGALTAGGIQGANQLMGNDVQNPKTIGQYYDQIRGNQAATESAHPAANLAGIGTGAVATLPIFGGIGDALAAGKFTAPVANYLGTPAVAADSGLLSKTGALLTNMGKGAVTAAPVGALYGAGAAPEGQELQGAQSGAELAGAIGGVAPIALSALNNSLGKSIIPNADELRSTASKLYQEASDNGGLLTPQFSNKFLDEATKLTPQTPLGQAVTGDTPFTTMINKLQAIKDQPMTLQSAQEIDEAIGDAIDSNAPNGMLNKQGKKLLDLQTTFRNSIDNAGEGDIVGGKEGFDSLSDARDYWAASRRMNDVERIITRAEYSDNPATAIKSGFRTILSNPNRLKGFSDTEINAMKNAASNGLLSETLKTLGSGLVRVMAPFSGAGLAGDAAISGASLASKSLSTKLAMNKAANVAQTIAGRVQPAIRQPLISLPSQFSQLLDQNGQVAIPLNQRMNQ